MAGMPGQLRSVRSWVRLEAIALLVIVLAGAVGTPGRALAGGSMGPRQMLYSYYTLINSRNFAAAYSQWSAPAQTYQDFVQGYADTSYVSVWFGSFQAGFVGGQDGRVPGVLIGTHTNGTTVAYYGCYELRYTSNATGMAQWPIIGANFQQLPAMPTSAEISQLMTNSCYQQFTPQGTYSTVQARLVDYVAAVNLGDFAHAYSIWSYPQQTYQQFVTGWSDTAETVLFYGAYQYSGVYGYGEIGRVPVVMLGYHNDGAMVAYQGCLGLSFNANNSQQWGLWSAYLQPMAFSITPDTYAVAQALAARCY